MAFCRFFTSFSQRDSVLNGSHAPLWKLKFHSFSILRTSIVFRARFIVVVVYSIVFSANPVKPSDRCVAARSEPCARAVVQASRCHSALNLYTI